MAALLYVAPDRAADGRTLIRSSKAGRSARAEGTLPERRNSQSHKVS